MSDLNWQQHKELFAKALELPSTERKDFLQTACADQPELLDELCSLIDAHDDSGDFLEKDIVNTLAEWESTDQKHRSNSLGVKQISNQPETIGSCRIVREIGRGGMGIVYEGIDENLGRTVAIKTLRADRVSQEDCARFEREARESAKVDHENVIRIFEVGRTDEGIPFIVMELLHGISLERLIDQQGALPVAIVTKIFRDVAEGLSAIHEKGLVHRDIKPANLFIINLDLADLDRTDSNPVKNLTCKILDFGLAQLDDERTELSRLKALAGTPAYLSPEQVKDPDKVDQRSDIFSFGVSLYQAITGEKPFRGSMILMLRQIEMSDPTPPSELNDQIPPDLESICLKTLEKDPRRRYASVKGLGEDLERFDRGVPTFVRPIGAIEKAWRVIKRRPRLSILVGSLVTSLVLVAALSITYVNIVSAKNRLITAREATNRNLLLQNVLDARPESLRLAIANLQAADFNPIAELNLLKTRPGLSAQQNGNLTLALAELGEINVAAICELVKELPASPWLCERMVSALKPKSSQACEELLRRIDESVDSAIKSRMATVLLYLGQPEKFHKIIDTQGNNGDSRYDWIISFADWHGDWDETLKILNETDSENARSAMISAIGLIRPRTIPNYKAFSNSVSTIYQQNKSAMTHSCAYWMLRKWESPIPKLVPVESGAGSGNWFVSPNGLTMVKIPSGEFLMGDTQLEQQESRGLHQVLITKPFYLAATETHRALWEKFIRDTEFLDQYDLVSEQLNPDIETSPTAQHPVQSLGWDTAIIFCNWLSEQEDLTPCYTRIDQVPRSVKEAGEKESDDVKDEVYQKWTWDRSANGYRLPTEAEWEYACRAGTTSRYYFGSMDNRAHLFGHSSNRRPIPTRPTGSLIPNPFGLFDMHGNVWEWTWDWYDAYKDDPQSDPIGPERPTEKFGAVRSYRGGGVANFSGDSDSDARGYAKPSSRFSNLGFRVARNAY